MGITQLDMLTGLNKVETAIGLIQAFEPPAGYYLAFSGGKDSVVLYDLAVKSGVKFDAHYCVSPIDPPQIYKFIKEHYPDVAWDYHARGFWQTVVKKGLPMRQARWCCQIIKEAGGEDRVVLLGNRRDEGTIRRHQKCFEKGRKHNKFFVRPILGFNAGEVWEYIRDNNLPYCELYDMGFKRLGCILCPFSREIKREMHYFPKVVKLWQLACDRIVKNAIASGRKRKHNFQTGEELFNWWVSRR